MSGIFQVSSGPPLTITSSADLSGTGLLRNRAVVTKRVQRYSRGGCNTTAISCVNYVNPSAFTMPAPGTAGNIRKGYLQRPGYTDWDTGLQKFITITERARLQFRAECFNVLNHTNIGTPITGVSSAGFGSIKSSNDPRTAQLALKFLF